MVQASAGGLGMGPLGLRGRCCVVELFSAGLVPLWGSVALTIRKGGGLARLSGCSGSALRGGAGVSVQPVVRTSLVRDEAVTSCDFHIAQCALSVHPGLRGFLRCDIFRTKTRHPRQTEVGAHPTAMSNS